MRIRLFIYLILLLFVMQNYSMAEICKEWSAPKKIGLLDKNILPEASGIALSKKYSDRLYHVNDSGNGSYFYITDLKGRNPKKILIKGYNSKGLDFEDISTGPCFSGDECIFIGDIGDNELSREFIEVIIIKESDDFGNSIKPDKRIKIKYPDGPHNAEGLAIHPNGDLYIVTKEADLENFKAYPSKVYRLSGGDIWRGNSEYYKPEHIGNIDLSKLEDNNLLILGQVLTGFDISDCGKKFVVLTYINAFEFDIDLSKVSGGENIKEEKIRVINLVPLSQQESISYINNSKAFIYDTEYIDEEQKIMRVDCID